MWYICHIAFGVTKMMDFCKNFIEIYLKFNKNERNILNC